ncbi:MAG: hypothetical protein IPK64_07085 [bacterium]|nr:hypothetical protein [bacterium]
MARFAWARRRRVLIPLVIVIAVLAAGVWLVPGDAVSRAVTGRLQAALGRPVTVGSLQARLLPSPRVVLRDVAVGAGGQGPLVSLAVARVELTLAFGPLLKRRVEVTSLLVDAPRVVVKVPEAGAQPAGSRAPAPAGPALAINVRRFLLTGASVQVLRADGAPLLELSGLGEDLSASLAPGGDLSLKGRTTVDTLRFHAPQGTLGEGLRLAWDKDLRWEAAARRLVVAGSTLTLGDLPVSLNGLVEDIGSPQPLADLTLTGGPAPVASLAGFLPSYLVPQLAGVTSGGQLAVAGSVKGRLGPPATRGQPLPFAYDISFDLTDGRVSAPSLPAPLTGIEIHLRAHGDTVELARFAAATPTSRLELSGTMTSLLAIPQVDLAITADLDLQEAMALQPPRPGQPVLAGRFTGTVGVRGPAQPLTALVLSGGGRLVDLRMSGPDLRPAIDHIDGPVRLEGQRLYADGVVYRQGPTDLTVTGTVDNFLALAPELGVAPPAVLAARAEIRMLDADAYAAPPGTKKEAAGPGSGLARLGLLTGHADATVKRLLTKGHELQDVQGAVDLDRGRLTLRDVRGTMYGGRVGLAGVMDLADPAHGHMDLAVTLAGVQAQELARRAVAMSRFARLGGLVTGLVDGQAQLKGALDDTFGLDLMTFTTNGQIELRQARLAGSPLQKKLAGLLAAPQLEAVAVEKWLQPFRIEEGKLHVDGLAISAAGVDVRAAGWQALDGTVALGVELTVPARLAQGLRAKLPAPVAAVLLDSGGGPLVVPVGLSGRWENPQVQLDTESLVAAAADRGRAQARQQVDNVRHQVQEQIQDQVQDAAAAALGRLTGLSGDSTGADSTATPPLKDQVKSILEGLRGRRGE